MKTTILSLFLACSFAGLMCGQEPADSSAPKPPPDPQVVMPKAIAVTKVFTYPDSAGDRPHPVNSSLPAQITELHLIKVGEVEQVIQRFAGGKTMEMWQSGGKSFLDDGTRPPRIIIAGAGMSSTGEASELPVPMKADFKELSWATRNLFTGEEAQGAAKCFVFKDPLGHQTAWIEETTHLPIRFESPKVKVLYGYQAPPTQLQLPATFAKALADSMRAWAGGPP